MSERSPDETLARSGRFTAMLRASQVHERKRERRHLGLLLLGILSGCGGGGSETTPPSPATHTVGGTASGLIGEVTLRINGSESLALTGNGNFVFPTPLAAGASYTVVVSVQPLGPDCTVSNASGVANANVTSVTVNCAVDARTFYVPYEGYPESDTRGSHGLYLQSSKALGRAPIRVASGDNEPVGIVVDVTHVDGVVYDAKPISLAYMTNGVSGGDHFWIVDLTGDSSLQPRQVSNLTVGLDIGLRRFCAAHTILRQLDDPSSAFFVLTLPTNPAVVCTQPPLRTVVIYGSDTANTQAREIGLLGRALHPMYRPDGSLSGLVLLNESTGNLEFYEDEDFENPRYSSAGNFELDEALRGHYRPRAEGDIH
jgi:hypothetical protein